MKAEPKAVADQADPAGQLLRAIQDQKKGVAKAWPDMARMGNANAAWLDGLNVASCAPSQAMYTSASSIK